MVTDILNLEHPLMSEGTYIKLFGRRHKREFCDIVGYQRGQQAIFFHTFNLNGWLEAGDF